MLFRSLAIAIKAIPMIRSGIETQSVPKSATLFRFRTANTAAATRNTIPIKRSVLDDKIQPPSGSSVIYSLKTQSAKHQSSILRRSRHLTMAFSCGARSASKLKEKDYMRSTLSRRQLQGFVILRGRTTPPTPIHSAGRQHLGQTESKGNSARLNKG